jgi:RNA polymerase sigma-70 factor (ECF subfamily)
VTVPEQPHPDSVLIERMKARDEGALSIVYDRYSGILFGMLRRILREPQAAEEVLQDVFLQLWRNPERFDAGRGSLPAWLLVIGRNRALSQLRHRSGHEAREDPGDYANSLAAPRNIEHDASRKELVRQVREALSHLPAEQKQVVELAYLEGLTQTEIAARIKTPLGTVKSRVRAAMERLKRIIDDGTSRQPGRL